MKSRKLGKSGLLVSEQGLGCMGMSEFYGARDDEESIRVIHRAMDLGITFFDTSDMYGWGHNEGLVGRALKGKRNSVILATKFGIMRGENGEWLGISGKPEYVQKACDASLRRLGMDVIDLYYLHRVDPDVPIEDTAGAMVRLKEQGKIRFLGLSEAGAQTIRRGHAIHPITALQTEYSLWERGVEKEILPVCRELGIGFVSYSPLGRGFLTGRFHAAKDFAEGDIRPYYPRFQGDNFEQNVKWLREIESVAAAKKCTPGQIALAWVLTQGEDVVAIPGTKRIKYLEENAAAGNVILSNDDLARLNQIAPDGIAAGTRYPAERMNQVGR